MAASRRGRFAGVRIPHSPGGRNGGPACSPLPAGEGGFGRGARRGRGGGGGGGGGWLRLGARPRGGWFVGGGPPPRRGAARGRPSAPPPPGGGGGGGGGLTLDATSRDLDASGILG